MKLLLDTHVLLWWQQDDPRLRQRARSLIADHRIDILVSVASFWEIVVKARIGKLEADGAKSWRNAVEEGCLPLEITHEHIAAFADLPAIARHGDPFDDLILAQAKVEGAIVMTADRHMTRYGVRCLGVG
jgi:PIN domain nuclease of toxin-antitoxin system